MIWDNANGFKERMFPCKALDSIISDLPKFSREALSLMFTAKSLELRSVLIPIRYKIGNKLGLTAARAIKIKTIKPTAEILDRSVGDTGLMLRRQRIVHVFWKIAANDKFQ